MNMIFNYCPRCQSGDIEYDQLKCYQCRVCGYTYFHNPAPAVAGIICYNEKLLLIKRARNPGKGKVDLPGGFIDPGESAEAAIRREIFEELGVEIASLRYISSHPNHYQFKGIMYQTCDFLFKLTIGNFPEKLCKDEVQEILLVDPGSLGSLDFAFDPIKRAVIAYFSKIIQS